MNIQTEHLENHTARLTVQVEAERVEQAMRRAARQIAQRGRIPGFRPGKAPYQVVLSMYGREYVLNEALDTLGNDIYREALEQAEINPYAPGKLEDVQPGENGLTLVFVVPKFPTVDLGNYRDIRVTVEPEEITDDLVNEMMENLRQNAALLEPVDRPAKLTDLVTFEHIEIVILPKADELAEAAPAEATAVDTPDRAAEPGETGDAESQAKQPAAEPLLHEHEFDRVLRDDKDDLFPGFSAQIVGMSAGENKTFDLVIPTDYEVETVAGRTLRCNVVISEIQARTVPEWTDLLAENISEGQFKTMLELRMDVRQRLEARAEQVANTRIFDQALTQLVEGATLHYPEDVVNEHLDDLINEFGERLREQNEITLDDFVRITSVSLDTLRDNYRPIAIQRAERALVLGEMVRQEQLGVNDADIDAQIEEMVTLIGGDMSGQFRKFLMADQSRSNIATRLLSNRATSRLIAIAKGENPPVGPDPRPAASTAETVELSQADEPVAAEASVQAAEDQAQPVEAQPEVSEITETTE